MSISRNFSGGYTAGEDLSTVIRDLDARVRDLEDALNWDEYLREQNPALQDLYEKFQLTKRLIA